MVIEGVQSLLIIYYIMLAIAGMAATVSFTLKRINEHRSSRRHRKLGTAKQSAFASSTELAIPEEPPKVYESYGHPAPPVALLGASLCQAPVGYGWEIVAVVNEAGNPALRLALLDLKTSTEVDAIERDMVIVRRWQYADDDTYAKFYRRAEAIEQEKVDALYDAAMEKYRDAVRYGIGYGDYISHPSRSKPEGKLPGKVMMANLITPMADWAQLLTLRYIAEHPDETKCNYMLIESTEGAK